MDGHQTVEFTVSAFVDPEHEAFDDPEWVADAATGALRELYGIESIYTEVRAIESA